MSQLPMLQVALDNQTLSHAYETTRLIAEEVDIIEVGTILCVAEGYSAGGLSPQPRRAGRGRGVERGGYQRD